MIFRSISDGKIVKFQENPPFYLTFSMHEEKFALLPDLLERVRCEEYVVENVRFYVV